MIELSQQISHISNELEASKNNEEHAIALEAYTSILKELQLLLEDFRKTQLNNEIVEKELGLSVSPECLSDREKQLFGVITAFRQLNESWKENDYAVKQRNEFPTFKMALGKYTESLKGDYKEIFQNWLEQELSECLTEEQISSQRKVDKLRPLAETYSDNYKNFAKWRNSRSMPTTEQAKALLTSRTAMRAARHEMIFDWPPAVIAFFTALGNGGAPLDMLTEEVLEWLKDHKQKNDYVIRRKVNNLGH